VCVSRSPKSTTNNVRIEPSPNHLRAPRMCSCRLVTGCRTGVEHDRTHAAKTDVLEEQNRATFSDAQTLFALVLVVATFRTQPAQACAGSLSGRVGGWTSFVA